MMNEVAGRNHNNGHQTNRPKRRRLEGPLIEDAFDARKFNLEKLPPTCLKRILSYMTYHKVTQMRQVSEVFNEEAIMVLRKGQKELEERLGREIERAEKYPVHFSINVRSSNDKLRSLNGLRKAIGDCTTVYSCYTDYFVAGKLLDEAHCLLKDLDSCAVVPYSQDHVCDQKQHPLVGPIVADAEKARSHFKEKINNKLIFGDKEANYDHEDLVDLDLAVFNDQNEKRIMKADLLENLRRKVDCGNELSRGLLKLTLNLNENVLNLMERAKKVDKIVVRVINGKDLLDKGGSNCHFHSSSSSQLPLGKTKLMGFPAEKRPNLATLPSSCVRNIVSHFDCHEMARMRTVSKSFNEAFKKELNREFENLKQKFQFEKKATEISLRVHPSKGLDLYLNLMKDVCSLFRLCEDNYKRRLGTDNYFVAGKILKEAKTIWDMLYRHFICDDLDDEYEFRPHYTLFHLMDMVYKSIAHFNFSIVPEYFPLTQNPTHVPDCFIPGKVMDFQKEILLKLEEIERLVEETEVKIKEQNDRNRKLLKVMSGLKKKVFVFNKQISERMNVLKELE